MLGEIRRARRLQYTDNGGCGPNSSTSVKSLDSDRGVGRNLVMEQPHYPGGHVMAGGGNRRQFPDGGY